MNQFNSQLIESEQNDNLLSCINNLFLNNSEKKEILVSEIANLHNEGKIDVIAAFQKLEPNEDLNIDFFLCRSLFESVLPKLKTPVEPILKCSIQLIRKAGNDLTARTPITSLMKFLSSDIEKAEDAFNLATTNPDLIDFIPAALISGAKLELESFVNQAIELTTHSNPIICTHAIHALGQMDYSNNPDLVENAFNSIDAFSINNPDEHLLGQVLKSAFYLYKESPDKEEAALTLIAKSLETLNSLTIHAASEIFRSEGTDIPDAILNVLQNALLEVDINNTGTMQNIELGIYWLYRNNKKDEAGLFLEKLLLKKNSGALINKFELFTGDAHKDKPYLNKLITRWLLSKRIVLCRAATEITRLDNSSGFPLSVDLEQIKDLNVGVHLFLARKACGWFFSKPISAASFIISLIDTANDEQTGLITEALFTPLIISYPGVGKKYLMDIAPHSSNKVNDVISKVLSLLDEHHDNLKSVHDIAELSPSLKQIDTHGLYMGKLIGNAYQEAQKGSITELLGKPSVLLYGNSSVHYIDRGPNTPKQRQQTEMQCFSHEVEFPSLEVLDPHGLDHILFSFKTEGGMK